MTYSERDDDSFAADADAARWMAAIARATCADPVNLDALLEPHDCLARNGSGRIVFASSNDTPLRRAAGDGDRPAIGCLLSGEDAVDPNGVSAMTAQLAALAIERDCEVVVISDQNISGFERFGFRVERVAGDTDAERSVCVQQIRDFWNCDVIL